MRDSTGALLAAAMTLALAPSGCTTVETPTVNRGIEFNEGASSRGLRWANRRLHLRFGGFTPADKGGPAPPLFGLPGAAPGAAPPRVAAEPLDPREAPRSTFGLDVDTGSFTLARAWLREGDWPPPNTVRPEEFVNAFTHRDDPPPREERFAVSLEVAPAPLDSEGRHLLRVGLRTAPIQPRDRRPASLVLVIDTSGSMRGDDKLLQVQAAVGRLVGALRPDDELALVAFDDDARVVLPPTPPTQRSLIRRAVASLVPGGSTSVQAGLDLGYRSATEWFRWPHPEGDARPQRIVRVLLFSDGVANVGETEAAELLERVRGYTEQGITLTTLGVGMGDYRDALLEQLADSGDGHYVYFDSVAEARRVLVEELVGTLQVVAKDAKAQVEFDPRAVASYRLIGYDNRLLAAEDFRDDAVDGGEVGAGHAVTALYELELRECPPDVPLATVRLRFQEPSGGRASEQVRVLRRGEVAAQGSWTLRRDGLVARFAHLLQRGGEHRDLQRAVIALAAERPADREVAELVELVALAGDLLASRES